MKNFYFLLLILFFFLNSCVGSDGLMEDSSPKTIFNYDYGNTVSRNFYGSVKDRSGNAVSGAVVSIGPSTGQTNNQGFFLLKNISVKEKFVYVKVKKSGYIDASEVLIATPGNNRINVMMIPATTTATVVTGSPSTVSLPNGAKLKFGGSFKDANGNAYSGNVNVALFHLKPSDTYYNETGPGNIVGADTVGNPLALHSYGMIHVQLTGSAGQQLQLATGQPAEITIPMDATQASTAPAVIPLWSFDEEMGIWKQEGSATKSGNFYIAQVSHFSWWHLSYPDPLATLSVTVQTPANQPFAGLLVVINSSHAVATDNMGVAAGFVPANQPLVYQITDLCHTVLHSQNIGPFAPGSSNTFSATVSTPNAVIVEGTLKDCSGNDVTDGMVSLSSPNYGFINPNLQLVTGGSFSVATALPCNPGAQFQLTGYDFTNSQQSPTVIFTATPPTTNVGILITCNPVTEFISYQIDSQTPIVCQGNLIASWSPNGTFIYSQGLNYFSFAYPNAILYTGMVLNSNFSLGLPAASPTPGYAGISVDANLPGNNLTFQVNNWGPVGTYVDFTLSGTYMDTSVSPAVLRTITGTGHVLRTY
ncbi:MAG: FAM171 family protein [Weeksellaceae bacterium]|nr:FAM171 family protein [Weeksellaceae bacterium]